MNRKGMTLLELLIVVVILVLLAALVVPMLGTTVGSTEVDVTYQTMQTLRDAIMGTPTVAGYFPDMKGGLTINRAGATATSSIADAAGLPYTVADLVANPVVVAGPPVIYQFPLFNAQTRKGWRGPYLTQTVGTSALPPVVLDSFPRDGAVGSPIIIEWPTAAALSDTTLWPRVVRLRSYGPDGVRTTALDSVWDPQTLAAAATAGTGASIWGDDLVLYIRRDLAGMDWTNYWEVKKSLQTP